MTRPEVSTEDGAVLLHSARRDDSGTTTWLEILTPEQAREKASELLDAADKADPPSTGSESWAYAEGGIVKVPAGVGCYSILSPEEALDRAAELVTAANQAKGSGIEAQQ